MGEDFDFNLSLLFGCIVGAATGYHAGGPVAAVDGAFLGFAASAVCAALLAEASYAIESQNARAARVFDRASPFLVFAVLLIGAYGFWK